MQNLFQPFTQFTGQIVTATGFSNWIQATGGTCSIVRIMATSAVTGDSITANSDAVYVFISDTTPVAGDKLKSQILPAGGVIELPVSDTGKIWISGASTNTVRVLAAR